MSKTKEFIEQECQEYGIDIILEQIQRLDDEYYYFIEQQNNIKNKKDYGKSIQSK